VSLRTQCRRRSRQPALGRPANPCFGLDFAAVAQIHAEIMAARNRGAAVLLVSEDLDELLELADRVVVMFNGVFVYEARASEADLTEIGRHMADH
jgi:simple sugar transport system ATP-binding protein